MGNELAEESDGSWGPFLTWSVPYSSKIEIIEFFLNNFQFLLFRLFRFSRRFRRLWSFNVFLRFGGDLLRVFFDLL